MPVSSPIGSLFWLIFVMTAARAQIHRDCAANVGKINASCCPIPIGFTEPCGGADRGFCEEVNNVENHFESSSVKVDDRLMWPIKYFKYSCKCRAKFYGVSCSDCWFGWTGENCNKRDLLVRRDVLTMSEDEKSLFQNVFLQSKSEMSDYVVIDDQNNQNVDPLKKPVFLNASVHNAFIYIHHFAHRNTLLTDSNVCRKSKKFDFNHNGCGFLTWHRFHLLRFERELQKIAQTHFGVSNFSIPYWDWVDSESCEICTNDLVGDVGEWLLPEKLFRRLHHKSPFYDFTIYCAKAKYRARRACHGCHKSKELQWLNRNLISPKFPTSKELEYVMSFSSYLMPYDENDHQCTSFHRALEGFCAAAGSRKSTMHNLVHNLFRGPITSGEVSPNDPLFFLHHSQVDRILAAWYEKNHPVKIDWNTTCPPGHGLLNNMVPVIPPVQHQELLVSTEDLGYSYDNFRFGKRGINYS